MKALIAIATLLSLLSAARSVVAETYICNAKETSSDSTANLTYTYERVNGGFNRSRIVFVDNDEPDESRRFFGDMVETVVNDWSSYTNHHIERENSLTFLTWHILGLRVEFIDLEEMQFQAASIDKATYELYLFTEKGACVRI